MTQDQHPFLSIVTPTYNGARFIRDTLANALEQPCEDLELIIGEDGSSDETLAICEEVAAADPRVRIDAHENYGVGKNLNRLIERARGEWLLILSQDDAILEGFYTEDLKRFLQECTQSGVDVIVPARLTGTYGSNQLRLEHVPEYGVVEQYSDTSWDIAHELSSLLYNVESLRSNALKFYEGWVEMETIFRHQAAYCAHRVLFTNDMFFAIRYKHDKQITATWDFFKVSPLRIDAYWKLCSWHERFNPSDRAAIERSWQTLGEIAIQYLLDGFKRYGLSDEYDRTMREGVMGNLLAQLPRELPRVHRKILRGWRKKRRIEWARDNRSEWAQSRRLDVPASRTGTLEEFTACVEEFPAVYKELCATCGFAGK